MADSQPDLTAVADPEHDASASYAIDPARARGLTGMIRAEGGQTRRTYSPLTGQPIADIPISEVGDVDAAFASARRAQRSWAESGLDVRSRALLDLHDLVLDRQREILDLIQYESGKARKHAFDEVMHVALTARYYGRSTRRHVGSEQLPGVPDGIPASIPCSRGPRSTAYPRASSASSRRGTTRTRWQFPMAFPRSPRAMRSCTSPIARRR